MPHDTVNDNTEIVDLLLKSGASLSVVNNKVITLSIKLRQSNIKLFKWQSFYSWNRKCRDYDVTKKYDLMAASNTLNRLICYKEWRKYQTCHVASSFIYLIELKQKMLILLEFVTNDCHLKSLIFDCLSFIESVITLLFTTDREAPDFNRRSTISVLSFTIAQWRGVWP
jgi:hypothetical protein